MRDKKPEPDDLYICKNKIEKILRKYNCELVTEDYDGLWLRDRDTDREISISNRGEQ